MNTLKWLLTCNSVYRPQCILTTATQSCERKQEHKIILMTPLKLIHSWANNTHTHTLALEWTHCYTIPKAINLRHLKTVGCDHTFSVISYTQTTCRTWQPLPKNSQDAFSPCKESRNWIWATQINCNKHQTVDKIAGRDESPFQAPTPPFSSPAFHFFPT